MPYDKSRKNHMEDTWKADEFQKALNDMDSDLKKPGKSKQKESTSVEKKHRDKDKDDKHRDRKKEDKHKGRERDERHKEREERHKDRDRDDKHRSKDREDIPKDHDKDDKRRDKDRGRNDKDRDKDRDRDDKTKDRDDKLQDKGREDRHRDRDKGSEDRHKGRDKDREREDRQKDRNKDREREDRQKDRDKDREPEDRHKNRDKDREREDRHKNRDKDREREDRHKGRDKDREREDRHKGRDKEREDRHKDRDKEREDRHKGRDKEREDRHKDRDKEREDRHKDRDKERKSHDNDREGRQKDLSKSSKDGDKERKEYKNVRNGADDIDTNGKNDEDDGYDDYDDDFEDEYDDDFDDDADDSSDVVNQTKKYDVGQARNSEMANILQAMNEENSRLRIGSGDARRQRETQSPTAERMVDRPKAFIDFFGAKQRRTTAALASKTRRRFNDLSRLIDLDKVSYDIFELIPMEEYSLYMRQFGHSNSQQTAVQTNEDSVERDCQTEDIECDVRWTQHPPEDTEVCGTVGAAEILATDQSKNYQMDDEGTSSLDLSHTKQLVRSLQVISKLLDEESYPTIQNSRHAAAGALTSGHTPLLLPESFSAYRVVSACFVCYKSDATLVTLHCNDIDSSLLCWNVHQPNAPISLLEIFGRANTLISAPQNLVVCGMDDGSLCLWDLKESHELYHKKMLDTVYFTWRAPTYSTAWSLQDNHHADVVCLSVLGKQTGDAAFQLVSLDSEGTVVIWVTSAQVGRPDFAGSHSDFGLFPGSRTSLSKSAVIKIPDRFTTSNALSSSEQQLFYIGTMTGELLSLSRFKKRQCSVMNNNGKAAITALSLSPHSGQSMLLVGCDDGVIQLFCPPKAFPQLSLMHSMGSSILSLSWSCSRPSVFLALDVTGRLLVYDLLVKTTGPVNQLADKVAMFSLNPDFHSTGTGVRSERALCFICRTNGDLQVHHLSETLANPSLDEGYRLSELLDRLGT